MTGVQQRWFDGVELADQTESPTCRRTPCGGGCCTATSTSIPQGGARAAAPLPTDTTALRELARWVANQVDETPCWSKGWSPETRERVLVCVGSRIADDPPARRASLSGPEATSSWSARERHEPEATAWLVELKQLVADSAESSATDDEDPPGVLNVAHTQYVTQSGRGIAPLRWKEILRGSFVTELIRQAANVDIHVIAQRAR